MAENCKTWFENYINTPIHLQNKEQAVAAAKLIILKSKQQDELETWESILSTW